MKYLHLHVLDNNISSEQQANELRQEELLGPGNKNKLWLLPNTFIGDFDDEGESLTVQEVKSIFGDNYVELSKEVIQQIMDAMVLNRTEGLSVMPAWIVDEFLLVFRNRIGFLVEWSHT